MRPVLLLDVRIVVLLVRPPARELNRSRLAVAVEMVVDELRAVVRIDAAQGKRQGLPDRLQSGPYRLLALAQHRLRLGPTRVNVGHIQPEHGGGERGAGLIRRPSGSGAAAAREDLEFKFEEKRKAKRCGNDAPRKAWKTQRTKASFPRFPPRLEIRPKPKRRIPTFPQRRRRRVTFLNCKTNRRK